MKKFVADLILYSGQDLEEGNIVDLWKTHDITKSVCKFRFKLKQRLESDFVDVLEAIPVKIRKILYFKLAYEILRHISQEEFPQGKVRVYLKFLFEKFFTDQLLALFLSKNVVINKAVDDHRLLFSFGSLEIEESMHLINVVIH